MLYINAKKRVSLNKFRLVIYNYIKKNRLHYSDQRERILKILHTQNYPVSAEFISKELKKEKIGAGCATVFRHLKFFEELELVIVVNKIPKGYLLKIDIDCDEVEVLQSEIE
ncbi:transcriptional repressor [Sulfurimonas sp.]|uniref:transcriptional repressor n=1 Tax=Sulfurimonas sp. TaxID=2022749 RepID=UPI003D0D85B3